MLSYLGYMTESQAVSEGFTHHGSYYGIPVWMSDEEIPMVATKWRPLEPLMTLFHYVEGFVQMLSGEDENYFMFVQKRKIEK